MRKLKIDFKRYDWILVSSSAGKDSQAMLGWMVALLKRLGLLDKLIVVHCDLAEDEWEGTRELAQEHAAHYGVRFEVVSREKGGILQHVEQRLANLHAAGKYQTPPWASSQARWCTSEHKTAQVRKLMTRLADELREQHGPKYRARFLSCMGMRAGESCAREKLLPFKLDKAATNSRRIVHTYLPIHDWSVGMVWSRIRYEGTRHHYAYDLGMPRLSCVFCIYAPRNALLLAGKHNRALLDKYCEVEERVGFSFRKELPLVEVRAALDRGEEPGPIKSWEM